MKRYLWLLLVVTLLVSGCQKKDSVEVPYEPPPNWRDYSSYALPATSSSFYAKTTYYIGGVSSNGTKAYVAIDARKRVDWKPSGNYSIVMSWFATNDGSIVILQNGVITLIPIQSILQEEYQCGYQDGVNAH